jgi:hypothetical protein
MLAFTMQAIFIVMFKLRAKWLRMRRAMMRGRIEAMCEPALRLFLQRRHVAPFVAETVFIDNSLDLPRLERIDRLLAAYQQAWGVDDFLRCHLLHVYMVFDRDGFCLDWQLLSKVERLDESTVSAYAGVEMIERRFPGLLAVQDDSLQRLWWADLHDLAIERLTAAGGQRVYDQARPNYGE